MNILKHFIRIAMNALYLPFKKIGQRRKIVILSSVTSTFSVIKKAERGGLLLWDDKLRRLYIAESLATVQLAFGADRWAAFLNNLYLYYSYDQQCKQWQNLVHARTQQAVTEAKKTNSNLTPNDLVRLKQQVQDKLVEGDVKAIVPKPFGFYVIGQSRQVTRCGTYDPDSDRFDIVSWDEIQAALAAKKS